MPRRLISLPRQSTASPPSCSCACLLVQTQARPLKRGLYSLHHVALHIGKLQLILSPHSPPWDPAQPPKPPVLPLVERKGGAAPKIPPLGHVDPSGATSSSVVDFACVLYTFIYAATQLMHAPWAMPCCHAISARPVHLLTQSILHASPVQVHHSLPK